DHQCGGSGIHPAEDAALSVRRASGDGAGRVPVAALRRNLSRADAVRRRHLPVRPRVDDPAAIELLHRALHTESLAGHEEVKENAVRTRIRTVMAACPVVVLLVAPSGLIGQSQEQETDLAGVTARLLNVAQQDSILIVEVVLRNGGTADATTSNALDFSKFVLVDAAGAA